MSRACEILHERIRALPLMGASVPAGGIYVSFEKGEKAHGGDRIVRIGTHRATDGLAARIGEHINPKQTSRSIFRKHIGRCLLNGREDSLLPVWDQGLKARRIEAEQLAPVEAEISDYLRRKVSFRSFGVKPGTDLVTLESALITTIGNCSECGPSSKWLGRHHPKQARIRNSGLWNVQGFKGTELTETEASRLSLPQR